MNYADKECGASLGGGLASAAHHQRRLDAVNETKGEMAEAERLMKRLAFIEGLFDEIRGIAGTTADKIIGSAPSSSGQASGGSAALPPSSFIGRLQTSIENLENVSFAIREQVTRIQRAF